MNRAGSAYSRTVSALLYAFASPNDVNTAAEDVSLIPLASIATVALTTVMFVPSRCMTRRRGSASLHGA
jgi:hypothetical protein